MKVLSIRQPWAWLILNAGKDIENRNWPTQLRGPILIHAGKTLRVDDYTAAVGFTASISDVKIPPPEELERGGIVGAAQLVDCVTESDSPWFFGPYGFVLREVRSVPFEACKGQLGFFNVD